jgi:acyl-coenzyme A thioesterase 13
LVDRTALGAQVGAHVPAGFELSERTGPFLDLIGPVYSKTSEPGIVLGLRARPEHCNARGFVHAAVLAGLLDVACGRNCAARVAPGTGLLTVSLNIDYVAAARDGDWMDASATVTRVGRRIAFAGGKVEVEGTTVAKASAVFAVPGD